MNRGIDYYVSTEYAGNLNSFDCGFVVFNEYLKQDFLDDGAAVHYIINANDDSLIAYFSLLASCIFVSNPDENALPAIELKIFAIDKRYRNLNLSVQFLEDIHDIVVGYLDYVGAKALILYSVPIEKVIEMYEKSAFVKMPENFTMYRSKFSDGCVPMFKKLYI